MNILHSRKLRAHKFALAIKRGGFLCGFDNKRVLVDLGFEVGSGLCNRIGNVLMRPGGLLRFKLFSGLS